MCGWKALPRTHPAVPDGTEEQQTPGHSYGNKIVYKIISLSAPSTLPPLCTPSPPPDCDTVPIRVCDAEWLWVMLCKGWQNMGAIDPAGLCTAPVPRSFDLFPPHFCTSRNLVPSEGQRCVVFRLPGWPFLPPMRLSFGFPAVALKIPQIIYLPWSISSDIMWQ